MLHGVHACVKQVCDSPSTPITDILPPIIQESKRKPSRGAEKSELCALMPLLQFSQVSMMGTILDNMSSALQAWLVVLLVVTARSQAPLAIAAGIALLTVIALPPRLWTAQLKRLGILCLFLFVSAAIFSGR